LNQRVVGSQEDTAHVEHEALRGNFLLATGHGTCLGGVRLKDVTDLQGARPNQLYGFGLVVGLANTGGKSLFTQQVATTCSSAFASFENSPDSRSDNLYKSGNISAVMVTAEIGPSAGAAPHRRDRFDFRRLRPSLLNGELLLTPLKGVDAWF